MRFWLIACLLAGFGIAGWQHAGPGPASPKWETTLSAYGFFEGPMAQLKPAKGVIPYDLNTPLFSDYAHKARFVKLPEGTTAKYNPKNVFDFPDGTYLIKVFYYPLDFRKPEKGRRILETRLLIRETDGWKNLPYIWNEAQTEAYLEVAGGRIDVSWKDLSGKKQKLEYVVPNMNQCKGCHLNGDQITPIGPSARQLNGEYEYATGTENQLAYWSKSGMLSGLPSINEIPRLAVWDQAQTGSLEERARAYLDINCGHCHQPQGPANTSGLFLNIHEKDPAKWGIMKAPVAAGRGSGGRQFSIVPGKSETSILPYRMESDDPGVQMPELGKKMIHTEGVALIKAWINQMQPTGP